jgi:hypothetical protein
MQVLFLNAACHVLMMHLCPVLAHSTMLQCRCCFDCSVQVFPADFTHNASVVAKGEQLQQQQQQQQ